MARSCNSNDTQFSYDDDDDHDDDDDNDNDDDNDDMDFNHICCIALTVLQPFPMEMSCPFLFIMPTYE